jgi:hypothetical protein
MPQRRSGASWKPGQSGNPRGRLPAPVDIAALARVHGPRCIEVAVELLDDADSRIRLGALTALLDRGYGKPKQSIETNDPTSPTLLHLLAAQQISEELIATLGERATIEGRAEPDNGKSGLAHQDLLNAPVPTE